jgi:hypothetical protein
MSKLGYTWYPKDWGNSESVFELSLTERGLYRELIDLAMLNDNKTEVKLEVWSRKFAIDSKELFDIISKLVALKLIELNDNLLFVPSCESRLNLVRGGSKGGKTSKPIIKPIPKPIPKPIESLSKNNKKPIANQIEKKVNIKEIEKESKNNIFLTDLLNSQSWLESLAMNNQKRFNFTQVKEKLNVFTTELNLKFDFKQNKTDFSSHFVSWLNKQENTKVKPYFDSPA